MFWLSLAAHAGSLSIPYERYELDNGLEVILHEDHDLPIVQVNIWYHVGSKDERVGRSGFAHLFEHLMFQGSANHDAEYFEPLQEVGGTINGTTSLDRTNYFEGVPAEHLPRALWLEADRMGWLLPALTQEKLDNQIDVVRNERRQRYDNQPFGMSRMILHDQLYPDGHPYEVITIGKHEDLEAATLDDVKAFFQTWYVPNNATLVVAGDFDVEQTKQLIDDYFGPIPAGPEPTHAVAPEWSIDGETRLDETDPKVTETRFWMVWKSPALYAPGDAELDAFSSAFGSGKDVPLYQALVLDQQIARSVSAAQHSQGLESKYVISGTVADGHTADEVIAEVDRLLGEALERGVTQAEIEVATVAFEKRFLGNLATVASKANNLNGYNHHLGEPDSAQWDLDRFRNLTVDRVNQVARETLDNSNRLILVMGPEEAE